MSTPPVPRAVRWKKLYSESDPRRRRGTTETVSGRALEQPATSHSCCTHDTLSSLLATLPRRITKRQLLPVPVTGDWHRAADGTRPLEPTTDAASGYEVAVRIAVRSDRVRRIVIGSSGGGAARTANSATRSCRPAESGPRY